VSLRGRPIGSSKARDDSSPRCGDQTTTKSLLVPDVTTMDEMFVARSPACENPIRPRIVKVRVSKGRVVRVLTCGSRTAEGMAEARGATRPPRSLLVLFVVLCAVPYVASGLPRGLYRHLRVTVVLLCGASSAEARWEPSFSEKKRKLGQPTGLPSA
jgi:hypothetical protein